MAESLPQQTVHSITYAPGKIIYHVRILDIQISLLLNLVPYLTGHCHGENLGRGRDKPRIDLH